jgi:hypothetical protein
MKEEVKAIQKTEYITTYISKDGREFKDKESCEKWEQSYISTITYSMQQMPYIKTNGYDTYLRGSDEDSNVWIVRPRNLDDILIINAYAREVCCEPNFNLTHEDVGKVIILDYGYDNCYCVAVRLEQYLQDIRKKYDDFINFFNTKEDNE